MSWVEDMNQTLQILNQQIFGLLPGNSPLAAGGFGINFDLFETNVINLAIVLGVLVYFGRGFVGNLLSKRRAEIEAAINEAEAAQAKAAAALAQEQQKLAAAKLESSQIIADAQEAAQRAAAAILAKSEADVARLQADASRDLDSERAKVAAQLRQRAVTAALARVDSQLRERLNGDQQRELIDRGLASIH